MAKVKAPKLYNHRCNQCHRAWISRLKHPKHCASCISDKWDQPLVGKKLRKAVPSRARLAKGRKGKPRAKKASLFNQRSDGSGAKRTKPPRAPRVKKEKGTLVKEQSDATE